MSSIPHTVPSRMAHTGAALYGHEDDTLVAWQQACTQTADTLRPQHDAERLRKALALAQDGHVMLATDGSATVTSGATLYTIQAAGACDCPDFQHRSAPCKHVLAVLIHAKAQEQLTPSPAPEPAAPQPAPAKRQARSRSAAGWDVHEAPTSSCFKIRVGALEWTHTIRASDDAELQTRLQAFLPTFREVAAVLETLHAEREAAKATPAAPASQPPAAPDAASAPADLQALIQQAVQQALAAQASNGLAAANSTAAHGTAASTPLDGPAVNDQETGVYSLHEVDMQAHTDPTTGIIGIAIGTKQPSATAEAAACAAMVGRAAANPDTWGCCPPQHPPPTEEG
jgi:hypothetical protein